MISGFYERAARALAAMQNIRMIAMRLPTMPFVAQPSINDRKRDAFEAQCEADASPWRPSREKPPRGSKVLAKRFDGTYLFGTFDVGGLGCGIMATAAWTAWHGVEAYMLVPDLPRWARK